MSSNYTKTNSDIRCVKFVDDILCNNYSFTEKSKEINRSISTVRGTFKKGLRALSLFKTNNKHWCDYHYYSMSFNDAKINKDKIRSLCLLYLKGDL